MKKISILLISALLFLNTIPAQAGILSAPKARIEQNKVNRTIESELKAVINEQTIQANKHCLLGLKSVYSNDFINSDGFNLDVYMKMIEETWETYPDIQYKTEINNIEFKDNYAKVSVTEVSVAAPKEEVGDVTTIGELYSTSKCDYFLEKHGTVWLISSEKIIEETSVLKFGEARFVNIELNAPKQVGAGRYYTSTLKVDAPKNSMIVASIGKENIVYPQEKSPDIFRKMPYDKVLERVFLSNKDNLNEYNAASIGITFTQNQDTKHLKVYLTGLAFIMTRVNVIPENKFVKLEGDKKTNEQNK